MVFERIHDTYNGNDLAESKFENGVHWFRSFKSFDPSERRLTKVFGICVMVVSALIGLLGVLSLLGIGIEAKGKALIALFALLGLYAGYRLVRARDICEYWLEVPPGAGTAVSIAFDRDGNEAQHVELSISGATVSIVDIEGYLLSENEPPNAYAKVEFRENANPVTLLAGSKEKMVPIFADLQKVLSKHI